MLSVPPPTRVALGTLQVGGQRIELFLSTEWARYFESLNTQVLASAARLAAGDVPGMAFLDDSGDGLELIPGPRGATGLQGDLGPALFMLQDDSGSGDLFVPGQRGADGQQGMAAPALFLLQDDSATSEMAAAVGDGMYVAIASKDATDGVPALTQFKLNLRNAANTITSWFTTAATAARTWTMPDKDGTVAVLTDFAAPPAIGNTTPATGAFTTVTATKSSAGASFTWTNGGGTPKTGYLYSGANAVGLFDDSGGGGNGFYIYTGTHAYIQIGNVNIVDVTSTGAIVTGSMKATTGFGCNGKAAQTAAASGGTLAGVITALVANGILSS